MAAIEGYLELPDPGLQPFRLFFGEGSVIGLLGELSLELLLLFFETCELLLDFLLFVVKVFQLVLQLDLQETNLHHFDLEFTFESLQGCCFYI